MTRSQPNPACRHALLAAACLAMAGRGAVGQAFQAAQPEPPMEQQETPSVLLPGIYLEEMRAPLKVGAQAPDFTLARCAFDGAKSSAGREVKLSSWLRNPKSVGSVVVFWAFWCDTWKDMTRDLNALRPQLAASKLQVLAVSVDASQQPVARRAFESGRIWWPVAIDAQKSVGEAWGVRRVPTIFVLDKKGVVRAVFEGFPGKQSFLSKARAALREGSREESRETKR